MRQPLLGRHATLQQQGHQCFASRRDGGGQRGDAAVRGQRGIGAGIEQGDGDLAMPGAAGAQQGGGAVRIAGIHRKA